MTTMEPCSNCGERFLWDPSMYRLCGPCLLDVERLESAWRAASVCRGACNGKAPSPGCGHASHSPYGCLHRDEDGVPCDCSGDATD